MSKTEQLQHLVDGLRKPNHYDFYVEYRRGQGWYLVSDERRHFHDNGEFMGANYNAAKAEINRFLS